MELFSWFVKHWAEVIAGLAAIFGAGAGGGYTAKKAVDKEQEKRIRDLEEKLISMDKDMTKIENDLATNIMFDKQFREQMEKEYHAIKDDMREVKGRLEQIFNHLLNMKQ